MNVDEQDALNTHLGKTFINEQQRFYNTHTSVEDTDNEEEPAPTPTSTTKRAIVVLQSTDTSQVADKIPTMNDDKHKSIAKAIIGSLSTAAHTPLKKKRTAFTSLPQNTPKPQTPPPDKTKPNTTLNLSINLSDKNLVGSIKQLLQPSKRLKPTANATGTLLEYHEERLKLERAQITLQLINQTDKKRKEYNDWMMVYTQRLHFS